MMVWNKHRFILGAAIVLILSLLVGCSTVDPIAFHDKVLDELKKLDASVSTLKEPTKAARDGSSGGAEALNTAYEGVKKTCSEVKKELTEMQAPSDEKSKAYFTAAKNYVETMDRAMHEEFPQIMSIYSDASLSSYEKRDRAKSLNQAISEKKKSATAAFHAANEEMAKALNIPLTQNGNAPAGE